MNSALIIGLSKLIEIVWQTKDKLFLTIIFFDNKTGNADTATGLDGIEFRAGIAVFEELLEGQHTCGDIHICKLDVSLGKSLFHRGTAGSVHAGIHNDLFHS